MAAVLNRTTKQYFLSVNTPDFPTSDWIINPDLSGVIGVPVEYWKITGDVVSEMNQSEKDAVDAVLIVGEKQAKVTEFTYTASRIVEDRYFYSDMSTFAAILAQALESGDTEKVNYITPLFDWVESIQIALDAKITEINGKTTRTDVANVTWDTSALIADDPEITIDGAMNVVVVSVTDVNF